MKIAVSLGNQGGQATRATTDVRKDSHWLMLGQLPCDHAAEQVKLWPPADSVVGLGGFKILNPLEARLPRKVDPREAERDENGGQATFIAAIVAESAVLACYFITTIPYLWFNVIGCLILIALANSLNPLIAAKRQATA